MLLDYPFSKTEEFQSNIAMNTELPFEQFLNQHDEEAWSATLATLMRSVHEVDRNATQIWFAFYPLSLFRALQDSDDREKLARQLLLQGQYELKDQIDASHAFLYGHRFWPQVKEAVERYAQAWQTNQFVSGDPTQAKAHATSLADHRYGHSKNQEGQESPGWHYSHCFHDHTTNRFLSFQNSSGGRNDR